MESRIVNLTPHTVTLVTDEDQFDLPPSGQVARCSPTTKVVDVLQVGGMNVPIRVTWMGEVSGLPEPEDGVLYLVSRVVAETLSQRGDLIITDDTVRDDNGRIVGCRAFGRILGSGRVRVYMDREDAKRLQSLIWGPGDSYQEMRDYLDEMSHVANRIF